jgi:hypothetical protein
MTRGLGRSLRHNTIALLALFLALGGTSFAAASMISGKQIKPHTIAKNRLTSKAIKQLKGNPGPQVNGGRRAHKAFKVRPGPVRSGSTTKSVGKARRPWAHSVPGPSPWVALSAHPTRS